MKDIETQLATAEAQLQTLRAKAARIEAKIVTAKRAIKALQRQLADQVAIATQAGKA
jgi:capsule polysaccharide export protein KpsE/RkpR